MPQGAKTPLHFPRPKRGDFCFMTKKKELKECRVCNLLKPSDGFGKRGRFLYECKDCKDVRHSTKTCTLCHKTKPRKDFSTYIKRGHKCWQSRCKMCMLKESHGRYYARYKAKSQERRKKYSRAYYYSNRDAQLLTAHNYQKKEVERLCDNYIINCITQRSNIPRSMVKANPEIIQFCRALKQLNRLIKQKTAK